MLYETIKRQIDRAGLTEDLKRKIDLLFIGNRITEADYKKLMGIVEEDVEAGEAPGDSEE